MRVLLGLAVLFPLLGQTSQANDNFGSLADDCYREWQLRGWVIGEDRTPAAQVPRFAEGVRKICQKRSELYQDDPEISPYIQGRLPELAPYVFSADDTAIEQFIIKLQERRPGPQFSGTYMQD
jgi:hypothetical protein